VNGGNQQFENNEQKKITFFDENLSFKTTV
jgi:hypothetical protein